MENLRILTKNLNDALIESKLSQAEFSRRVDVEPSSVAGWLSGRTYPTQERMFKIASVLNKPSAWFYQSHTGDNSSENAELLALSVDSDTPKDELNKIVEYINLLKLQRNNDDAS